MRMYLALRLALAVVVGLCACSTSRSACGGLRAGCAKVDITPPLGLKLIGSQGKPSDCVLHLMRNGAYASRRIGCREEYLI